MKKLALMLTAIAFIACGDDKKKTPDTDTTKTEEVKKPVVDKVQEIKEKYKLKEAENLLENPALINLSEDRHAFNDNIVFEEVNVLKTGEDTYSVLLVLSERDTNFDELLEWTVAIIATPKKPKEFADPKEQKKGNRTIGIYRKPEVMGKEIVVHLKDFKIKPKEFSFIRFFLLKNSGEKNTNYLVIKDTKFPS